MTLSGRDTLIDRPEIINRNEDSEVEDNTTVAYTVGEGGGPVIHNIEFRPGDYEVVASSNVVAVLASGEESGDLYNSAFRNAAIQLSELYDEDVDIHDLTRFGIEKNIANNGLTDEQVMILRDNTAQQQNQHNIESPEEVDVELDDDQGDTNVDNEQNAQDANTDDSDQDNESTSVDDIEDEIESMTDDEEIEEVEEDIEE